MKIHIRMGHPSFHLLQKMYPHLFKDLEFDMCICNACQLGKFKHTNDNMLFIHEFTKLLLQIKALIILIVCMLSYFK